MSMTQKREAVQVTFISVGALCASSVTVKIPAAKLDRDAQITFHLSDSFSDTTAN